MVIFNLLFWDDHLRKYHSIRNLLFVCHIIFTPNLQTHEAFTHKRRMLCVEYIKTVLLFKFMIIKNYPNFYSLLFGILCKVFYQVIMMRKRDSIILAKI